MKKYLTNLCIILASGLLITSTMFLTSIGSTDSKSVPIENGSSAKSSQQKHVNVIPSDITDVNKMFDRFSPEGKKQHHNTQPPSSTEQPGVSSSSSSDTSSTTSGVSTTSSEPQTSKAATTTTTVKPPEDESKNIEYIKDPNYISPFYIVVYTGSQSAVVYGKDESGAYNVVVKAFTVSTGRIGSTPTRKGVYKIRAKYRWRKLMGDCYGQYSSSISPNYLFHSVPYAHQSANSLYNASYNNLGRAVSHGCIRMCVRDCKWIYDNCPIGTQVHVVWTSGPKGAGVPRRKSGARYSGWDPSDQWSPGNPYFSNASTTESEPVTTVKTTSKTTVPTLTSTSPVSQGENSSSTASSKTLTTATSTSTTTSATTTTTTTTTTVKKTNPSAAESSHAESDIPVG